MGGDGPDRRRVHGGGGDARPRDRVRRHGLGRHRRHHAGGRRRVPRSQARPHDRRPAGRRGRDGRRPGAARRRRARARPVLGDPRRRRQLRRRDAVPVPPARGRHGRRRHAVPARDTGDDRRVHRRGRGRAGGAVDDRERDAGAADADDPRGASRPPRHHGLDGARRSGRRRRTRRRAVPGACRADRRHAAADCRTRRCTCRRTRTITRSRPAARCSSTGSTDGVANTILDHLEASNAPMRVAQLRVLGGAMARVPADATAFAHRSSRIMVNVGGGVRGAGGAADARGLGRRASRRRCTRATTACT